MNRPLHRRRHTPVRALWARPLRSLQRAEGPSLPSCCWGFCRVRVVLVHRCHARARRAGLRFCLKAALSACDSPLARGRGPKPIACVVRAVTVEVTHGHRCSPSKPRKRQKRKQQQRNTAGLALIIACDAHNIKYYVGHIILLVSIRGVHPGDAPVRTAFTVGGVTRPPRSVCALHVTRARSVL